MPLHAESLMIEVFRYNYLAWSARPIEMPVDLYEQDRYFDYPVTYFSSPHWRNWAIILPRKYYRMLKND